MCCVLLDKPLCSRWTPPPPRISSVCSICLRLPYPGRTTPRMSTAATWRLCACTPEGSWMRPHAATMRCCLSNPGIRRGTRESAASIFGPMPTGPGESFRRMRSWIRNSRWGGLFRVHTRRARAVIVTPSTAEFSSCLLFELQATSHNFLRRPATCT